MIFKTDQEKTLPAPTTLPAKPQHGETVKPASGETPCVIGIGVSVIGKITSSGFVQIEGHVQGEVRASTLVINGTATIEGDVSADSILVRGKIVGNVRGRDVQLRSTGRVEGPIFHQLLAVETGAAFEGKSCPSKDPMHEAEQPLTGKTSVSEHRVIQAA